MTNPLRDLLPLTERGWLSTQPADFQAWIARAGRWRQVERNQTLYEVGDDPDALYGLGSGALEMLIPLGAGEQVVIHRAEPGFWIGDSAILAHTARSISVRVASPGRVFRVPAAAVRHEVAAHPSYWESFYRLSHINQNLAVGLLAANLSLTPRAQFARMLLRLSDGAGAVQATQEELARLAGMSRASFRRAIAELIDSGAIETIYGGLRIRDAPALEAEIARG